MTNQNQENQPQTTQGQKTNKKQNIQLKDLTKMEKDILRLIQAGCHFGSKNYNIHMQRYISYISKDWSVVFDLVQTIEKVYLAAKVIAAFPNPEEVLAVSSKQAAQRAAVKFSKFTGCSVNSSSKWTPGSLTNYETKQYQEPKLLIIADPYADYKAIKESSYVNIPIIALCDTHHSLKYVDIAIPCNTSKTKSVSMIFWLLAREINVLQGKLDQNDDEWSTNKDAMYDLFLNRNVDDIRVTEKTQLTLEVKEKEEQPKEQQEVQNEEEQPKAQEKQEKQENQETTNNPENTQQQLYKFNHF